MNSMVIGGVNKALKILGVATGVFSGFAQGTAVAQEIAAKANPCYTRSFSRQDGPIKDLVLSFDRPGSRPASISPDDNGGVNLSLEFTEWDVPNYVFEAGAGCTSVNGAFRCQVSCDGGHASVRIADDGRLFMDASGMRTFVRGDVSLMMIQEADGGSFDGLFALSVRPGETACSLASDVKYVALQAGDISDRVKDLEKKLNSLGQFLEFPDQVFDKATADAVRAFQRQYGLGITGVVDAPTAMRISNVANSRAGGC